jgi:L-iditol 2-dehydrogenase
MQVAELHDVDDLRIVERPTPQVQAGEILVRIAASGICSGDLMPWYIRAKAPLVLGHEPTGEIVAVGGSRASSTGDGTQFKLGDRVVIHHHAPCFACDFCERGAYVHCATWRSSKIDPGGIAEYVRVPAANLGDTLILPATMAFDEAVLIEPLGCVMKSLRRAKVYGGDVVYVIGLGVMGLLHVAVLESRGYTVVASDPIAARRDRATELGAIAVEPADAADALREAGAPHGAHVVICGPSSPAALEHACETVAPAGTVLMFTPIAPDERFIFDQSRFYFRDISLIASYSCGPNDTREALQWLASSELRAADFGAVRFPLAQTGAAYAQMTKTEIVKAIITFA